jgi:hypothetical protein
MSVVTPPKALNPALFGAIGEKIRKAKNAFKRGEKSCLD